NLGRGVQMPPLKAFMDDTTVIANSRSKAQQILNRLDSLIAWARMKFKPEKSRSLSLNKGKISEKVKFEVGGQTIPTVSEAPVKSLGRWYNCSLKDTEQGKIVKEQAENGLTIINKTKLQGKFKVWILQFMLIRKLFWPLQIYEIGLSTVEVIERKINRYTRKWLGLPPVALYSRSSKLQLSLQAITEEDKVAKSRLQLMLMHSSDPAISSIEPVLKTGRKWKVRKAIQEAEESARLKEIVGATQTNRLGLGYGKDSKQKQWSKVSATDTQALVIEEVRSQVEQEREHTAIQQSQQGQWTTWEDALQRSISWTDIWHMAPLRLSFIIRAVYDQLPAAANLDNAP